MDKQFGIYSINFRAFYTDDEMKMSDKILEKFNKMHDIERYYGFISKYNISKEELNYNDYIDKRTIKGAFDKYYSSKKEENKKWKNYLRKLTLSERKKAIKDRLKMENKQWKSMAKEDENYQKLNEEKKILNTKLNTLLESFKGVRVLREELLLPENIIQLFSNSLSRTMNIEYEMPKVCKDIICITISNYSVMNQIITNGFTYYDTELKKKFKYRVLTASAGQIRKKKIVFIKEELWNKYSYSIMCGLSWDRINSMGGMNINKFLAYLALQNSATDVLEGFNIDECIVVDDFETTLTNREVDFIEKKKIKIKDKKTDKEIEKLVIKNPIKTKKDITITHTDGCGLVLKGNKSFQIRLPFIKGLMTPTNYIKFCEETEGATTKVVDLWGKEWDIKKDNIKYIFTKSQFKMAKYYTNIYKNEGDETPFIYGWEVYKACFKAYNCQACYCNKEENEKYFRKGQFNYQYWQSLTDVTDEEIKYFTSPIVDKINKSHYDVKTMLSVFGISKNNNKMNIEQKLLNKYPVLLKDFHFQDELSSKLSKVKKDAKSGKFKTNSINTFLLPDVYAWMQNLFCHIENPKGLLDDEEVSCKYFEQNELLLDRSPHLYREHAVRRNINCKNTEDNNKKELFEKYFITNGIYTSTHDLITKILMFDVDGDHSLVTSDKKLIEIAKRNCKDIIPLYYDMGKAGAEPITKENIIKSLISAFKYGNIGVYSNKITNLWNTKDFDEKAFNLIKLLTAMNNYSIDSAKTLEMVDFDLDEKKMYKDLLKKANGKMPYFFQFAKDKPKETVEDLNDSTVNRICKEIESVNNSYKYDFSKLGKFNASYLYKNKSNKIDLEDRKAKLIIEEFEQIDKQKNYLFKKAQKNKQEIEKSAPSIYEVCKTHLKSMLSEIDVDFEYACDVVTKYYFTQKKNYKKSLLFNIFGDIILNNLKNNLKNKSFGFCENCGERFERKTLNSNQKYCNKCAKEIKQKQINKYKRDKRNKNKE